MTEIVPKEILGRRGNPYLTDEQVFRLWRAAVKDDARYVDWILQKTYDGMMAFDPERSQTVIESVIKRHKTAGDAFRSLIDDMQGCSETAFPQLPALPPARLDS
jgi:hypothetical protein